MRTNRVLTCISLALALGLASPLPGLADSGDAPAEAVSDEAPAAASSDSAAAAPAEPSAGSEAPPSPEGSGTNSILLFVLVGLGLLGLLAAALGLLGARGVLRGAREETAGEAQRESEQSRRGGGAELDDARRDLEAIREVLRAGGHDAEVSRCREVERELIDLQETLRLMPRMGAPSADKVPEAQGIAQVDAALSAAAGGIASASAQLRDQLEAGQIGSLHEGLDSLSRQAQEARQPLKDRPDPVVG